MTFEEIKALDDTYYAKTFTRLPAAIDHGEGALLYDTEGRRYIDFSAGVAVNTFGVNDEGWKRAVAAQLNKIQHVSNHYDNETQVMLARALCNRAGARRVFFVTSGAEANECALKAARKYSFDKYGEGRSKIVALKNSFHGRTLFTLSVTGQEYYHQYFDPFVSGVEIADCNIESVKEKAGGGDTCAVILECVQGESGVTVLDKTFVKEVEAFCRENDILLIVDEVQTGIGRTGSFFAYQNYRISPDLVTCAKGLGGGLPVGACLFYEKTENVYAPGDHGSTFGGNPVTCAGALHIVSRINDELLYEVQGKGAYLMEKLKGFDGVTEVSGLGLMIGLSTGKNAKQVVKECFEKGLLLITAHSRVRILPPLNITKTQIDEGLSILKGVLK